MTPHAPVLGGTPSAQLPRAVRVTVMPKAGVNDPEGEAISGGLHALGYGEVQSVRAGRVFYLDLHADSDERAVAVVSDMCDRLLANPVIESYHVEPVTAADPSARRAMPPGNLK